MEKNSKEIVVYKLGSQQNKPTLGYLRAVAEKEGDSYVALNAQNFCPSEKVFVTRDYEEINDKYKNFQLFKVTIIESQYPSDDLRPERNCKYVTKFSETSDLKPRDLVEIISCTLPDPNMMVINITTIPSTTYIYINDKGVCYGPFKWNIEKENQIELKKLDSPLPGKDKGLTSGTIYSALINDLKRHLLECNLEEGKRTYFQSMTDLHNDTNLGKTDYYSDDDIVSNFLKLSKEIGFNNKKIDLVYLEANVKKHPRYNHKSNIDKLKKLKDISNDQVLFRDDVIDGFSRFLRSDLGEEVTRKYIDKNKDMYLLDIKADYRSELENDFRESNNELAKLKDKINVNKQELIELGQEIEEINKIRINSNIIDSLKDNEDLDDQITKKEELLNNLNEQIKPLLEKHSKFSSLEDFEKKLANVKIEHEYEMKRKFQIADEIKRLESQYNEDEDKLRVKLFEMKPFVEAINGNVGIANQELSRNISQEVMYHSNSANTAQDIIKYIKQGMAKENRSISILDVINITVILQQSFICFLAGLPGGGKTTLARLVAKIHGIQNSRFLEVPVARGWTGQRDLIGFFNPITGKFQSSSTGLYEFLYALSEESKDENLLVPLSMVLLDEANLSPMEHYWSLFMGQTDSNEKKLTLGNDHINIPENLRFISTINYDSTTEYLSARLIDRAPIIVLEPNNITTNLTQDLDEQTEIQVPISYETMEKYFGRTHELLDPEFDDNERRVYERIRAVLEIRDNELGKPVLISSRKEIAIRHYCNKARPLMREFSADDELLALDYAVLQLILPLLRGHGKKFSKRLEQLKDVLSESDLYLSLNYLETIISNGNADLHTYDFFCW